jgi:hypothetical protein
LSPLGLKNDNLYEELEQRADVSKPKLDKQIAYARLIKENMSLAALRNRSWYSN